MTPYTPDPPNARDFYLLQNRPTRGGFDTTQVQPSRRRVGRLPNAPHVARSPRSSTWQRPSGINLDLHTCEAGFCPFRRKSVSGPTMGSSWHSLAHYFAHYFTRTVLATACYDRPGTPTVGSASHAVGAGISRSASGCEMTWGHDDLVDKLIANNAARPHPGMDKPDRAVLTLRGGAQKTRATAPALSTADRKQDTQPSLPSNAHVRLWSGSPTPLKVPRDGSTTSKRARSAPRDRKADASCLPSSSVGPRVRRVGRV